MYVPINHTGLGGSRGYNLRDKETFLDDPNMFYMAFLPVLDMAGMLLAGFLHWSFQYVPRGNFIVVVEHRITIYPVFLKRDERVANLSTLEGA